MTSVTTLCWALVWYALSVVLYFQFQTQLFNMLLPFGLLLVFFVIYMNLEEWE
jgi:hypothetical protein